MENIIEMSKEPSHQGLYQVIKRYIHDAGGWITFAEFMQKALYEPGLGYYVAGTRKFGKEGDFITAPEISSAFSQCVARFCQKVCQSLSLTADTSPFCILEFGAGTGVMAADILLELEKQRSLPKNYFILEVSPDLEQRQREMIEKKCPHLFERVQWLSALPKNFSGVVIANEVLDAMPVHVFEMQERQCIEKGVSFENNEFIWKLNPLGKPLRSPFFLKEQNGVNGYTSEYCPAIKPWLLDLYNIMISGVVLLIDYGFLEHEYYHPQRDQGTLMCHYRHRAHTNPFINIGLQDITAHVDFSAVARAAEACGFSIDAYTTQADFLMSLGILDSQDRDISITEQQYEYRQALKLLLLPSEMGELFKVMRLSKSIEFL